MTYSHLIKHSLTELKITRIKGAFGLFDLDEEATVYLYQKLGIAETNRPLLSIKNDDERKVAVFSGSGFWKWSLQESGRYEKTNCLKSFSANSFSLWLTKDDKRNFRVSTIQSQYYENEGVELNTEVYNQLFEKVYDYNIDLKITNAEGITEEYNYVNSPSENYKITGLPAGVYQFEANTSIGGKREEARGSFSIEQLALEDIYLTANFQLLRNISNNSGGQFYTVSNIESLITNISNLDAKPIARSNEDLSPIINNPWILALLALLLSIEWFTRKYNGSY